MKPSFALNLSHEGIRLLFRAKGGWRLVGEAELDSPDLEDTLRYLRDKASGLSPSGIATKLILPNSEILYTSITATEPDRQAAQIRETLEDMTPYSGDDLAFDWTVSDDLAHVAAVARETLAEAEDFAVEHGFNPVSFVADPGDNSFDGEPFFGPSRWAAEHLDAHETVERDDTPVVVLGKVKSPRHKIFSASLRKAVLLTPAAEPATPETAPTPVAPAAPEITKPETTEIDPAEASATEISSVVPPLPPEFSDPPAEADDAPRADVTTEPETTDAEAELTDEPANNETADDSRGDDESDGETPSASLADEAPQAPANSETADETPDPTPEAEPAAPLTDQTTDETAQPDTTLDGTGHDTAATDTTVDPVLDDPAPVETLPDDAPLILSPENTEAEISEAENSDETADGPTNPAQDDAPEILTERAPETDALDAPSPQDAAQEDAHTDTQSEPETGPETDEEPNEQVAAAGNTKSLPEILPEITSDRTADEKSQALADGKKRLSEILAQSTSGSQNAAETPQNSTPPAEQLLAFSSLRQSGDPEATDGSEGAETAPDDAGNPSAPLSLGADQATPPRLNLGGAARIGQTDIASNDATPTAPSDAPPAGKPAGRFAALLSAGKSLTSGVRAGAKSLRRADKGTPEPAAQPSANFIPTPPSNGARANSAQPETTRPETTQPETKQPKITPPDNAPQVPARSKPLLTEQDDNLVSVPISFGSTRSTGNGPLGAAPNVPPISAPIAPPTQGRPESAPNKPAKAEKKSKSRKKSARASVVPPLSGRALGASTSVSSTVSPSVSPSAPIISASSQLDTPETDIPKSENLAQSLAPGATLHPQVPPPMSEAEALTVFGARKDLNQRGKPKYLGVLLTACLIAGLVIVGLWTIVFDKPAEDLLAASTPSEFTTFNETLGTPANVPSDAAAQLGDNAAPTGEDVPDTTELAAIAPDVIAPDVPAPDAALPQTTPPETGTPEAAPVLGDIDAPIEDILSGEVSVEPEAPRLLSDTEAAELYAQSGVLQKSPQRVPGIVADNLLDLYVPSIDPAIDGIDALALPAAPARATDLPPPPQSNPAPAGSDFALGDNGLVVPSPQGTMNPDGVLIYSGRPPTRSKLRPNGLVTQPADAPAASDLPKRRPPLRPDDLADAAEKALLGGRTLAQLEALPPTLRPQSVQQTAAAEDGVRDAVEETLAELANAPGVKSSGYPAKRPDDMEAIVAAALANPENQAAKAEAARTPAVTGPVIPTRASVATAATQKRAINTRKIALLGVFGTSSDREALVRMPSGRVVQVRVGDRVDGGKVAAIGTSELRYVKGGRSITLEIAPRG